MAVWLLMAALSHSFRHNTGTSLASTLNLAGIVVPGPKIPALLNNRVLYRDGSPVAALVSGEIEWIERLEPAAERLTEVRWSSGRSVRRCWRTYADETWRMVLRVEG